MNSSSEVVVKGTEPSTDAAGPAGRSKGRYFIVITLVALAMSYLPGILSFELIPLLAPYFSHDLFSEQLWILIIEYSLYLISPVLFFVILYFYGKRMERYFADSYLGVILFLFLGSILGYVVYFASLVIIQRQNPILTDLFWLSIPFQAATESIRIVFVGFTALGLAYLRTRNPPTALKQNPPA